MSVNRLIELGVDGKLTIQPEALAFPQYSAIWDRDTSTGKEKAIMELSYIWYMKSNDTLNPYREISSVEAKDKKIRDELINIQFKGWKKDKIVHDAMELYVSHNYTADTELLINSRKAMSELSRFLGEVSLDEKDEFGKPLYKPKDITSATLELAKARKAITELQQVVQEGLNNTNARIRGNRVKGAFED